MKETAILAAMVVLFAYGAVVALFAGLFRSHPSTASMDSTLERRDSLDSQWGGPAKGIGPKSAYWTVKSGFSAKADPEVSPHRTGL